MKKFLLIFMLIAAGTLIWYISSRLSADAIGMAIGILLGVLAGLPAAILVMASGRRQADREESRASRQNPYGLPGHAAPAPPLSSWPGTVTLVGSPCRGSSKATALALRSSWRCRVPRATHRNAISRLSESEKSGLTSGSPLFAKACSLSAVQFAWRAQIKLVGKGGICGAAWLRRKQMPPSSRCPW